MRAPVRAGRGARQRAVKEPAGELARTGRILAQRRLAGIAGNDRIELRGAGRAAGGAVGIACPN